jgi:hypothetical protein
MEMEDSSLGLSGTEDSSLHIWSRKVNTEGAAEWVQCRVIDLEKIMPMAKHMWLASQRVWMSSS